MIKYLVVIDYSFQQWADGMPEAAIEEYLVREGISHSYLGSNSDGVRRTAVFAFETDPSVADAFGTWLGDNDYDDTAEIVERAS